MASSSVIIQLQEGASDSKISISDILRKAKIVAFKLKIVDLLNWIDAETSGYKNINTMRDADRLPPYRRIMGRVELQDGYNRWQILTENGTLPFGNSISEVEQILRKSEDFVLLGLSQSMKDDLLREFPNMGPLRFKVSMPVIASIADGVRNYLLHEALKLEEAGIMGEGFSFTDDETRRAQELTINNTFNGPVAGFAQSGGRVYNSAQTISSVTVAELQSLVTSAISEISKIREPRLEPALAELRATSSQIEVGRVPLAGMENFFSLVTGFENIIALAPAAMTVLDKLAMAFGYAGWPA